MSKRRLLIWLLFVSLTTLLGIFDALRSYAASYSPVTGRYYLEWNTSLAWNVTSWNLWILLAPLVLRLGQRFSFDGRNWRRRALALMAAGVFFALAHSALVVFINFFIIKRDDDLAGFLQFKYFVLMLDVLLGILVYGLILAFSQAINYYKQYRGEELRTSQLRTQLAQAQLQALKMQLHPHFIFNALHSISANLRDTESARSMIARLGDFLRLTLANAGAQEVTLKQELDFLRCYLDIEQARFRERLTVEMEIEPETWDARLPNLILQPIVENAIKHGIAPRRAPGRIEVRACRLNGHLQVQIQDNGRGLRNSQNGEASNATASETFTHGIGLATTRARLEHLYPAAHRLQLRNAPEGGLVVTLEVPFNVEADNHQSDKQS